MKYGLLYLLLFPILISCKSDKKTHPNFNQLPTDDEINYSLDVDNLPRESTFELFDKDSLKYLSSISHDSSGINLFGVKEVNIDPEGKLYLIQERKESISVYNARGVFQYEIGRKGKGPGEFLQIQTFDFNESFENLIVLDKYEIEIFSLKETKYQHVNTIYPKVSMGKDMCVLNENIYYSGFKYNELDTLIDENKPYNNRELTSGPIHKYNLDSNKVTDSFGPFYHSYSGWWMLDAQLSSMNLACNNSSNTIVGLNPNFGYFFGYKPDGELKWRSKLDNFNYSTLTEMNINTPRIKYSASSGSEISPFRKTDSKYVVFQIANSGGKQPEIILDTENGQMFYQGSAVPSLFNAKYDDKVVTTLVDSQSTNKINIFEL